MSVWEILSAYPSNIYTILIGVIVIYWLFVIIGAADIDIFTFEVDIDPDIPGFVGLMQSI